MDEPELCALCDKPLPRDGGRCLCLEPDWTKTCEVCGSTPIVPATGLCGPCNFGDADTVGGNW